jgi:predicted permease
LTEEIFLDLRYAARQVWRASGFAMTVILTLALGIGTNLGVFQLLRAVMFSKLPVAQPEQLYSLRAVKSPFDAQWFFSYPAYQRLRESTAEDAQVLARAGIGQGILQSADGTAQRARYELVSNNFFDVLRISPSRGRFFDENEARSAGRGEWPAILRFGYWKDAAGSDPGIIGRRETLNGVPIVIVGVGPEHFSGVVAESAPDFWLPLEAQATGRFFSWFDSLGPGSGVDIRALYMNQAGVYWLWLMARVQDPAMAKATSRWTATLQPDLAQLANNSKDARERERILASSVTLVSAAGGEGTLRENYSQALFTLMAMAGMVLLVGCVNLANLQLARLIRRDRELMVRRSLGASRWRIVRLLFAENLLLAVLGTMLAIAVGRVSSGLLVAWASGSDEAIPLELRFDWQMFAVAAALLVAAVGAFSVFPAWRITSRNCGSGGSSRANAALYNRNSTRLSSWLLAGQVSFSILLVGVAGLFAQTLRNLDHMDAGLDRDHVVSAHFDFSNWRISPGNLAGIVRANAGAAERTAGRAGRGGQHVRSSWLCLEYGDSRGRASGNRAEADAWRRKSCWSGIFSNDGHSDLGGTRVRRARPA